MEKFNRFIYTLIGDPRHNSLEHRLFNSISLLNGFANIVGVPALLQLDYLFLALLTFSVGVVFVIFYYFSRFHSIYRSLYWPFVLLILIYLFVNILANAGSLGGAHYYLIPGLVISIMLSRSLSRSLVSATLFAGAAAALFYIEDLHPDWITPYKRPEDRALDAGPNYVAVQIFTGALVLVLARSFSEERNKSDRLLQNVLPDVIAEELKRFDRVEPQHYAGATVLFTDFVGFTKIAERLSPQGLIAELDACFRAFDQIMRVHGLEKIKTIGDSYMAVAGIPEENLSHPVDAVLAALDIQRFMAQLRAEKSARGEPCWELRLGMHTGDLVAGVIGEKKFAYDVWGDTVNTASRLESSGAPGRVNISETLYERVKDLFECEYRGKVIAKNKGEIDMYFVLGLKPEYAEADGRTPNARFQEIYRSRFEIAAA